MANKIKVGILRETKNPPDKRVAITPVQAVELMEKFPNVELFIQPSDLRCYKDEEYEYFNLNMCEDLSHCDILIGVKEVNIDSLIDGKTYMFFAHVAKKQAHNKKLMRALLEKRIKLIDYEYLTDTSGNRVVAFGRWAGIVGAYNGLRAKGLRTDSFKLKAAHQCHDVQEMWAGLKMIKLRPIKILITGGGRVAHGAIETLSVMKIRKVNPEEYLNQTFDEPVYTQIDPDKYVRRKDGKEFDYKHFFSHPQEYESTFLPYTKITTMLISCHFWDPKSPVLFTREEMKRPDFKISVIADVTCDINGSVPSTVRSSTIADPFYGYDKIQEKDFIAFSNPDHVTVMAVDNLPGELPRDASSEFGRLLTDKVFPSLFEDDSEGIVLRATITDGGKLTSGFSYLEDYSKS